MKVLFDFEILSDAGFAKAKSNIYYKLTKEFFIQKYKPVEKEIDSCQQDGDDGIVIIFIEGDSLKTIPLNIPDHLLDKLNACITKQDFEAFQEKLLLMKSQHKTGSQLSN